MLKQLINCLIDTKLIGNDCIFFPQALESFFKQELPEMSWFHIHNYEYLLLFFVLWHSKQNMFELPKTSHNK